jgi:hypothetical protein
MMAMALVTIACVALTIAHFVVDAHKGRDVACFDIPGAFLHADFDEDITIHQARELSSHQAHQAVKPDKLVKPLSLLSC